MIVSFVLAAVLFVAASLGWGMIFHSDRSDHSRRVLLLLLFFVTASSVFSSIFFLKGLAESGSSVGLVTSSLVFALAFVLSLFSGWTLTSSSRMTGMFSYAGGIWKNEIHEKDRADVADDVLEKIAEAGEIDALEKELIGSILKFKDKIVREVMIPRGDIVALNLEEDPRRVMRLVAEEGYSRMPVYSGSIDNIVGIIYAKDMITMAEGSRAIVLQDILRAPYYVPESKKISQLLREMQRNKVHLAIVVDEFGGTEGIVTLEDVLEEIVGEIQDEYDESLSELTRDDNGEIHFAGSMSVDRFNELLEADIPREEDYDTVAGFVQMLAGKLPQKGEVYNYKEMYFIVEDVARHRIKRLKVSYKEHPPVPDEIRQPEETPQVEQLEPPTMDEADIRREEKTSQKQRGKRRATRTPRRSNPAKKGRGTGKKK